MKDDVVKTAPAPLADDLALQPVEPPPQGIGRAVRLFATGALGGFLALMGLGVLAVPHSHRCCGATTESRLSAERQRRCMELGVTPEELDRLEPLVAARSVEGEE